MSQVSPDMTGVEQVEAQLKQAIIDLNSMVRAAVLTAKTAEVTEQRHKVERLAMRLVYEFGYGWAQIKALTSFTALTEASS